MNKINGQIPIVTGLATTAALNAVKNETPNFSDLVKKTDYDAKASDIWLNLNIFPLYIIINIQITYLMQK